MILPGISNNVIKEANNEDNSQNSSNANLLQMIQKEDKEEKRKNMLKKQRNYGKQVSMFVSSSLRLMTKIEQSTQNNNRKKFFDKPSKTRAQFFHKTTTRFIRTKSFTNNKKENSPLYLFSLIDKTDKNTKYGQIHRLIHLYEIVISVLSLISIVLMIADNEIYVQRAIDFLVKYAEIENTSTIPYKEYHLITNINAKTVENAFRIGNIIISVIIVLCVIMKNITKYEQDILFKRITEYDKFSSSKFVYHMIIESIIGIIFYPPYVNCFFEIHRDNRESYFTLNAFFAIVSLSKLYLAIPLLKHLSIWGNHIAQTIYRNNEIKPSLSLYFKLIYHNSRLRSIAIYIISIIVTISFLIHFVGFASVNRTVGSNHFDSLSETFWITSNILVGIGEMIFFPSSFCGRFLVVITAIFHWVIYLLIILTIGNYIFLSEEEGRAYMKMKKMFSSDNKEQKAVNVIKMLMIMRKFAQRKKQFQTQLDLTKSDINYKEEGFSFRRSKSTIELQQHTNNLMILEQFFILLLLKFYSLRFLNNYIISSSYSVPIDNIVKRIKSSLEDNVNQTVETFDKTENINDDFLQIAENQLEFKERVETLVGKQKEILNYLMRNFNSLYYKKTKRFKSNGQNEMKHRKSKQYLNINLKIAKMQTKHLKTKLSVQND